MSTYTPIASQTTTGSVAAIYFDNIPQTYTDLVIVMNTVATASVAINITFNGDTAGNYAWMQMWGPDGSAVHSENAANRSFIDQQSSGTTYGHVCITNVNSYSNTNVSKMVIQQAKDNVNNRVYMQTAPWRNTAAITSLALSASGGNIAAGSTFNLYGIQVGGGYATGGNIIVSDGSYWYHAFTSSGVFTPTTAISADVLCIAGGGGGGSSLGGGGGAGGLRGLTAQSMTATPYAITVGAGGTGSSSNKGATGTNSSVIGGALSLTSDGGGGGGRGNEGATSIGINGGSGGGAGSAIDGVSHAGGTATSGQGNNGGSTTFTLYYGGGGGGGAGAIGSNGAGVNSGLGTGSAGGVGSSTYSSWASATVTGVSGYYAGGGGGGGITDYGSQGGAAIGGTGGGGTGGINGSTAGGYGTANTGSGGGGGGPGGGARGGDGGSGIVIVRYAV